MKERHTRYSASDLRPFIAGLAEKYRLAAPAETDGRLEFMYVKDPASVVIDDRPTYKSAKEFVFPQNEAVLVLDPDGARQIEPEGETVVFGVRPCDLAGLTVMKAVFTTGRYADPFFEARMKRTVVIGLGCEAMKGGCFCDERGIDLGRSEECDIFVSPGIEDDKRVYALAAFSERGETILEEAAVSGALSAVPAGTEEPEGREATAARERTAAKGKDELRLPGADENLVFNLSTWERASQTCIGCGTCTFICPTCHCFAFRDIREGNRTVRYRIWDSCMFPRFTAHASGHNPRATRKERYRQRVMHKYLYVPANYGLIACTGCGRCVRSCPAGVSIREIVREAAREIAELRQATTEGQGDKR